MPDNKNLQDGRDDSRIDLNDPSEVERLHQKFPNNTHEEIKAAVKQHGPLRKDIEDKLKR